MLMPRCTGVKNETHRVCRCSYLLFLSVRPILDGTFPDASTKVLHAMNMVDTNLCEQLVSIVLFAHLSAVRMKNSTEIRVDVQVSNTYYDLTLTTEMHIDNAQRLV